MALPYTDTLKGGDRTAFNMSRTFASYCTPVTSEILVDQAYKKFKGQST
jgi:hypothetical protein